MSEARRSKHKAAAELVEGRWRREESFQKKKSPEECEIKKQFLASVQLASANYKRLEHLQDMVAGVWSDDGNVQLKAAIEFRELLSIGDEVWSSTIKAVTIGEVIKANVVPRFVQFLAREDLPRLQFESAWVLTNIASGTSENTNVVIDNGAVPIFVELLASPNEHVREQAVWALGNVAGDSRRSRDVVLSHGALVPLVNQLDMKEKVSILRNVTWALANICRGMPHPPFDQVKVVFPALVRVIIHTNDREVLTCTCWILYFISNSCDKTTQIQAIVDTGLCSRVVKLLPHPSCVYPVLQMVKNIICRGSDMHIRYMIGLQVLPFFFYLLTRCGSKLVKMIVCYTISILTSKKDFIQDVINNGLVPPLLRLLQNAESKVKELAALAITNTMVCGSHEQIKFFGIERCVEPLCSLLSHGDEGLVMNCLKGIEAILKVGEEEKKVGRSGEVNLYAQMICECGGLEKMESLCDHANVAVYEIAMKIMNGYWLKSE